ncbi:MAG: hypothetical protein RLP44_23805 [Aggregatilineales bacterium]
MSIVITLLDIIVALSLLGMFTVLLMVANFSEGGGSFGFSLIVAIIITVLVMTMLYTMRYQIFLILVGIMGLLYWREYKNTIRPENIKRAQIAEFYARQLVSRLQNHRIIYVKRIADEPLTWPAHLHLFIDRKIFDSTLHHPTTARWEIIPLTGKENDTDYRNIVFIAIILDSLNNPPIALPFFAGTKIENEPIDTRNLYLPVLCRSVIDTTITLYPMPESWFKQLIALSKDARPYCDEMVAHQQAITCSVPPLNKQRFIETWGIELMVIDTQHRGATLRAFHHYDIRNIIECASAMSIQNH